MTEIKDKVVTAESLKILHENNINSYMQKNNPAGNGNMTIDGNADFTGSVNVGSFMIGSKVKIVPMGDSIEIVFLDEEITNES